MELGIVWKESQEILFEMKNDLALCGKNVRANLILRGNCRQQQRLFDALIENRSFIFRVWNRTSCTCKVQKSFVECKNNKLQTRKPFHLGRQ